MTKARDIASAAPAPSTVDATEIGYLDGVSSAIQTQINNKLNISGGVISANSAGNALEIRQVGTGNALVVEDAANPDSTPFVIASDGRVGIGVSSPGSALDINGSTNVNGTSAATVRYLVTQTDTGATVGFGFDNSNGLAQIVNYANAPLRFSTNNSERMRIAADGATTITYTTTTGGAVRNIYMSTSAPTGGSDGDVWIQYA